MQIKCLLSGGSRNGPSGRDRAQSGPQLIRPQPASFHSKPDIKTAPASANTGSLNLARASCAISEPPVIPALRPAQDKLPAFGRKAGTQSKQGKSDASRLGCQKCWVPAFAGMTIQIWGDSPQSIALTPPAAAAAHSQSAPSPFAAFRTRALRSGALSRG
jgi:hypothetical protein